MKKLFVIGLIIASNLEIDALQSNAIKNNLKFGQLCGDDHCNCPDTSDNVQGHDFKRFEKMDVA